ncbi:SusC/RagA family TonB-linked outer membrane protein [Pedobacter sp. AW31-3R]|uniref:SusC/RagA family TonB-linked outer membrane protein n=1 Tax=Pedobacter sp. AW31-3R TaxID=3445781 RepID=UPI003F9F31FD
MKRLILSLFLFLAAAGIASAQNRTISGTVKGKDDGLPLPGVSVKSIGSTASAVTDAQGKFSIGVAPGTTAITFSFIGYTSQSVKIGSSDVINVSLASDAKALSEVVVTALGIQRNRNQVAYAAQSLDGAAVSENRSPNLGSSLSGKVSGLEIRQNNTMGGSTNVVIRGVKSMTNNNQALFVVDGVPIANNTMNTQDQQEGVSGYDYGNPASDINPDDVENITVLKGAAASALYGSRGSNGVILITTKKGKSGLNITVNAGLTYGTVDKSTFPKFQKKYGAGYGPYYGTDESQYLIDNIDVNGDGINDLLVPLTEDASYGAKFDPSLMVYQWDAFDPTSPNFGKAKPWVAGANDPTTFFEKPLSNNQSIVISNSYDKGTFKLGYTRDNQNGILPNSNIKKDVLNFGSTYNLSSKLTAGASINYSKVDGRGRYGTGYSGNAFNPMTNFRQWWQTNVDVQEQKDAYFRLKGLSANDPAYVGKENVTWNPAAYNNPKPIFWNNPYFAMYENYETDTRDRYIGNVNLNYKVTDWLNLMGRYSLDSYHQIQEERVAIGSLEVPTYSKYLEDFTESNLDFLATFDKNIGSDVNLKALLGTNVRRERKQSTYAFTNGGLSIPGIYSLSNSVNPIEPPVEYDDRREIQGVFGGFTATYKNTYTLDATLRRDVSSTLPDGNNAYYYPSVSGGFIFSELLKDKAWLSYGKLRANYAEVGGDAPIYKVLDTKNITASFDGRSQASLNIIKNNPGLKPERSKSAEIGIEAAFLKNRLGFDFTYYNTKTVDQIVPVVISGATGYAKVYQNSGTIENKGIELSLNGLPVKTTDFEWRMNVNFTRNRNKVTELFADASGNESSNLVLTNFQNGVSVNASLGQPYGTIRGSNFVYNSDGQKLVDEDGYYLQSETANEVIGNMNPKWTAGINNSFKYKNLNLSFLIDIRKGGSVYSLDQAYGLSGGLYEETAGINELGNESRLPVSEGGGIINPGVHEDGTPNTTRIENNASGAYGYETLPNAAFVYDAGYIKLREVIIGYTLPQSFTSKLGPIKGIDVSLIGRNLWIIHKNLPNADPEDGVSFGNVQGYQVGSYPSVRNYTFNLKVRF